MFQIWQLITIWDFIKPYEWGNSLLMLGAARLLPPYSLQVVKGNWKGRGEGLGSSFYILSCEKTDGEGRVMSP